MQTPDGVERTLDWVPRFDDASNEYGVDRLLVEPILQVEPVAPDALGLQLDRHWVCPLTLDQWREGECVGYGWAHALATPPKPQHIYTGIGPNDERSDPERIYTLAQQLGGQIPDEQSGTSVLDGARAVRHFKWIKSFHWAFGIDPVIAALRSVGPVVLGIPWTEAMFTPYSDGTIQALGKVVGGHCILLNGVDATGHVLRLHNSWGPHWGVNGECFISAADLAGLLRQRGEACVAMKS